MATAYRRDWNKNEILLRKLFKDENKFESARTLFFKQHAQVHTQSMADTESWSYEDEVLEGLTDEQFREIPPKDEHSIAWILWHITRCEDITMNLLVAARPQVLHANHWQSKIGSSFQHTGNGLSVKEIAVWSRSIEEKALRSYREAVGKQTRKIIENLPAKDFKRKPTSAQIELVWKEAAVLPNSANIVNYWSRRTVAGLLLMPATRHLFVHWNEAAAIKRKLASLIAA
jgi:hypothetical protein